MWRGRPSFYPLAFDPRWTPALSHFSLPPICGPVGSPGPRPPPTTADGSSSSPSNLDWFSFYPA